jgi:Skp family chaperone for outer membrane proteins
MENKKNKTQSVFCEYSESADEHKKAVEKYNANPNEYNKTELERQTQKLDKFYEEIKKLDISETLSSLYNKYS